MPIALGFALVASQPPASATHIADHDYSVAFEATDSFGVGVYRWDRNIDPPGGVYAPTFEAPVVSQTQWVLFQPFNGQARWVELGTMHKDANCKWWFVFWFSPEVGEDFEIIGQTLFDDHNFYIVRGPTGWTWQFTIDSTPVFELAAFGQEIGLDVSAGLESYTPATVVSKHGYYNLRINVGGPWASWAGRDALQVNSPLCGRFISDTTWQAAQNSPCN